MPDPSPIDNATCRMPTHDVVDGIDEVLANGTWYVTNGFNPDYDCFMCQELSFDFGQEPLYYNALFNLIAVNGSLIWSDTVMRGSETSPGILTLYGHDAGFSNVQTWYFMLVEDNTMMVYYCGDLMSWHFEGVLILSRYTTLEPDAYYSIQDQLAVLDLTWDDLCDLTPQKDCVDVPQPFYQ